MTSKKHKIKNISINQLYKLYLYSTYRVIILVLHNHLLKKI